MLLGILVIAVIVFVLLRFRRRCQYRHRRREPVDEVSRCRPALPGRV
jgi:hypothetical protein